MLFMPDWLRYPVSGFFAGSATVLMGEAVAPKQCKGARWTMVLTAVLIGILGAIEAVRNGEKWIEIVMYLSIAVGGLRHVVFSEQVVDVEPNNTKN